MALRTGGDRSVGDGDSIYPKVGGTRTSLLLRSSNCIQHFGMVTTQQKPGYIATSQMRELWSLLSHIHWEPFYDWLHPKDMTTAEEDQLTAQLLRGSLPNRGAWQSFYEFAIERRAAKYEVLEVMQWSIVATLILSMLMHFDWKPGLVILLIPAVVSVYLLIDRQNWKRQQRIIHLVEQRYPEEDDC